MRRNPTPRPCPRAFRIILSALFVLAFSACGRDAALQPAAGSLPVAVFTEPRSPAAPVVGAVDSLRVYLRGAGNELLVHPVQIAIAPDQARFNVALEAVPGNDRSITVLAIGPRPVLGGGEDSGTERGILFAGRASGIDIASGRIPTVNVTLGLFVPEFQEPLTTRGSFEHTVSWSAIPVADHYLLTIMTFSRAKHGVSQGSQTVRLSEPKYTGTILPARYQVQAVEFSGLGGAPSDFLDVVGGVPNGPVLSVTGTGPNRIDLGWTSVGEDLDGYELERSQSLILDFTLLATLPGSAVSYSDVSAVPETGYTYRLRALSPAGPSAWSNMVNAQSTFPPPGAPVNVTARAVDAETIVVDWGAGTGGADSYEVERRPVGGGFQRIAEPAGDIRTHRDAALSDGVVWEYRVRALSRGGVSAFSNIASASTPIKAPDGFTAVASSPNRVDLAWNDNSTSEIGYEIHRSTAGGSFQPLLTVIANAKQYGDVTVAENTSYTFRVRALNGTGVSDWSEEKTATTPIAPPGAPQNLTATAQGSNVVILSWALGTGTITAQTVERRIPPGGFSVLSTVSQQATGLTDTGVTGSTTYEYRVKATNDGGDSPYSNLAAVTTPAGPPSAPTGLVVTAVFTNQINLSWSDNSSNETGFQVERASATSGFVLVATLGANVKSYASQNLASDTQYSFRVRAMSNQGPSAYSNTAQATTLPLPPAEPTEIDADGLSGEIGVFWRDNSLNESGFRIERRINNGAFVEIGTTGPNLQMFSDTNPVCSATHAYRVRAFNSGGNSLYTAESRSIFWECAKPAPH